MKNVTWYQHVQSFSLSTEQACLSFQYQLEHCSMSPLQPMILKTFPVSQRAKPLSCSISILAIQNNSMVIEVCSIYLNPIQNNSIEVCTPHSFMCSFSVTGVDFNSTVTYQAYFMDKQSVIALFDCPLQLMNYYLIGKAKHEFYLSLCLYFCVSVFMITYTQCL